ncbi:hypothetical protein DIPPA_17647 [Diplonema papillatum]|nr:hypothetical protein DIPPA_17647 [Diplonema papillatum]|eukprot:gene7775-11949_t
MLNVRTFSTVDTKGEVVTLQKCCTHNEWDNVRVLKGSMTLRCRICQKQWRAKTEIAWGVLRCPEFLAGGTCSSGDACGKLHIHYRKQSLHDRVEKHGELVLYCTKDKQGCLASVQQEVAAFLVGALVALASTLHDGHSTIAQRNAGSHQQAPGSCTGQPSVHVPVPYLPQTFVPCMPMGMPSFPPTFTTLSHLQAAQSVQSLQALRSMQSLHLPAVRCASRNETPPAARKQHSSPSSSGGLTDAASSSSSLSSSTSWWASQQRCSAEAGQQVPRSDTSTSSRDPLDLLLEEDIIASPATPPTPPAELADVEAGCFAFGASACLRATDAEAEVCPSVVTAALGLTPTFGPTAFNFLPSGSAFAMRPLYPQWNSLSAQ